EIAKSLSFEQTSAALSDSEDALSKESDGDECLAFVGAVATALSLYVLATVYACLHPVFLPLPALAALQAPADLSNVSLSIVSPANGSLMPQPLYLEWELRGYPAAAIDTFGPEVFQYRVFVDGTQVASELGVLGDSRRARDATERVVVPTAVVDTTVRQRIPSRVVSDFASYEIVVEVTMAVPGSDGATATITVRVVVVHAVEVARRLELLAPRDGSVFSKEQPVVVRYAVAHVRRLDVVLDGSLLVAKRHIGDGSLLLRGLGVGRHTIALVGYDAAGDKSVFKGALGWDDWIWWTAIGGVALFLFLLLLCCCVCMQRAKRKGRQEALAAVQARQREQAQREEAQMRYAQAQQARYPAPTPVQEQNYKYSQQQGGSPAGGAPAQLVPAGGPKKNYGPQVRANAGYAAPPHAPHQQQPQYGHQPSPYNQPQPYGQPPPPQHYGQNPQQQYSAMPAQTQQQQQPSNYYAQQAQRHSYTQEPPVPVPAPVPNQNQNYERKAYNKPKPWHAAPTADAPYRAADASFASTYSEEANRSLHEGEAPFVAVTSPAGRESGLAASKLGTTLRDRIDALREGSVHDNHTRISVGAENLEPPPIGAGRRSLVLVGTVLSEKSEGGSSPSSHSSHSSHSSGRSREPPTVFKTARSTADRSDFSHALSSQAYTTGQFDDAETFAYKSSAATATTAGARERVRSGESASSRGSVEF
ncbi:hypothetical protein PybrP1_011299, partial [[Pythium] brassicae (nom. inval.)]